ncbi:MAG: Xaa-Pro peptidase family protein [Planctomycetota bacterium]|nr:Xaa-Pro peptidase family protein [Planctomycetota bacterium]MDA1212207.1 Xaa-Pro peptidase family protein [Planctomycetota bacterium]
MPSPTKSTPDRPAQRRQRLLHELKQKNVPAMLVTDVVNVTYLTGFSGDSSYLLLGKGVCLLISDARYTVQIEEECPGIDALIRKPNESLLKAVQQGVKQAKCNQIGFEAGTITYQHWQHLEATLDKIEWIPCDGLVETLRQVKDATEIAEIRLAVEQAERGFALIIAGLTGEMTELQVAHDLEHAMRRFGAAGVAFDPIVAVGARAALPHARPQSQCIADAPFTLIDWGARTVSGYRSDLTRLVITGKIPPKLAKVYRVVLNAQLAGIEAIRPGVRGADIDRIARSIIEKAGFGRQFGHSLGHGVGLHIHEAPRLSSTSNDELEPGMIVTVEPGIYLPGWGGVRIEDDILVTRDGCEVLTSVTKEWDEIQPK